MGDNGLEEELEKTQAVEECVVGGREFWMEEDKELVTEEGEMWEKRRGLGQRVMREAERGEVTEKMRDEADKREWDEGGKEVLGKGCVWIKRGSGKGRMGFRGRFSQLRGHRQRRTGRRKWGDIRDSRNRKGRLMLRWRN